MINEYEIRAALASGKQITHDQTRRVIQQNSRGKYIVSKDGKRIHADKIKGFYDALYFWEGVELPAFREGGE